jgi:hypothetical protein
MIYNVNKKECLRIGGAKLWEQTHAATSAALLLLLSNSNGRGGGDFNVWPKDYKNPTLKEKLAQEIMSRVSGRWAGDKILVQGDYAEKTDKAFISEKLKTKYKDISREVAEALLLTCGNDDECPVANIIKSEINSSYGSLRKKV